MPATSNALLTKLLRETSRSFYLTLRVLPRKVRPQIGLAYLLARTTDTIADTEIVPVEQRLAALQNLRERILGSSATALSFSELARQQGSPAERVLLEKVEESLAVLSGLAADDLKLVRQVLDTITSGQELDLRRFESGRAGTPLPAAELASDARRAGDCAPDQGKIIALQSDAELDDYTYRVAGCVGEFWTKICCAHLFPTARLDDTRLLADSVRFGKGLQLVNILRDLPADLRKRRCYLPEDRLFAVAGLRPADLLRPANEAKFRPFYERYLNLAEAHLAAGWAYTNALPWRCVRVRLACAWPILIGAKTLARLRVANALDPQRRVKVSRAEVRGLILRSVLCYPLPGVWQRLISLPADAGGQAVSCSKQS
ncbi:MAG: squalene/phytoene synthase family protein [Verrucomicrobia bacterium]|jgi:farnesyl-diphosphate farnesyltransferase|nr:squalene/phytoene synthase family protein [Verrucomicrobiota bacterium]